MSPGSEKSFLVFSWRMNLQYHTTFAVAFQTRFLKKVKQLKFIKEAAFYEIITAAGIGISAQTGALSYTDNDHVVGFDMTNLTVPDTAISPFEPRGEGDRSVEYAMVSALFKVIERLGRFPVYLFAADDEWADDEIDQLAARGFINKEETRVLAGLMAEGHGMDVAVVEKEGIADAVRLIAPQITTLSTTCHAMDGAGKFLATFSQDDEVSFDTTDPEIYAAAKETLTGVKNLPFEIIWGDELG